jgi:hypothetical protein
VLLLLLRGLREPLRQPSSCVHANVLLT